MEVKFAEYRFQREQLTLYKQQEIIPLKHTQALLLDFFLADPEAIHSKEAIMDAVWQGKVVSEQVVFQTISQLRALFGSAAIKTFSKKGYQWQLIIEQEVVGTNELTKNSVEQHSYSSNKTTSLKPTGNLKWFIAAAIVVLSLAFYWLKSAVATDKVVFHLVEATVNKTAENTINHVTLASLSAERNDNIAIIPSDKVMSARQSFLSPKRAWQLSNMPQDDWLLWTVNYQGNHGVFLNYGLAKGSGYWHGYVYAETEQQLANNLAQRLIELEQLGLFLPENTKLDITALDSMIKRAPDDVDLLLLLAKHYFDIKQYDVALTYAQKLIKVSSTNAGKPYRAKAHWLMAEIYNKRGKYQLASHALKNMSDTLEDTSIWPLQFKHIKASAWLAKAQADFDSMFRILDNGLKFGRNQGDALLQFELHILYSILAKKGGDDHKKYAHLNAAQALLLKHQLDESNFAVVYYHFAIFSTELSDAVPYFEKILALPKTAHNAWIVDHATELLIDQYIKRQDFQLALTLLEDIKGSAKYMLSMARIYHAKKASEKARDHFEKAFELARLNYEVHIGIDSALMLYQLTKQQPEIQAQYLDYLKRNANADWLENKIAELVVN